MPTTKPWKCPACKRQFTRANQRHACGTGERAAVLRNRPPELVEVFSRIEALAKALGPVEFVARERYVLLRTTRIFADVVVMAACIRLAVHLPRKVEHALFSKIVADQRHVTHVALLHDPKDVDQLGALLREAYDYSRR